MSKVLDAPADSSTAPVGPEDGFAEFQTEQRSARAAQSVVQETEPKVAPASEPEGSVEGKPQGEPATPLEKKAPLTDEEKSAIKHANDERRWTKLNRDLGAARAETERLKAELAAKAESATAPPKAKTVFADDPNDPRPEQADFTGEDALDEYLDARSTWNARRLIREDREAQARSATNRTLQAQAEAFNAKAAKYAAEHDGFNGTEEEPGALQIVTDALEEDLGVVSIEIAAHEKSPEIIDYLGKHPEMLQRILAFKDNPARALIEYGRLIQHFDEPQAEQKTVKPLPKVPATVGGRRPPLSQEAALDAAADDDDFPTAQRIFSQQRAARARDGLR